MSKERGLLNLCAVTFKARNICPLLLAEISELLAQPEQEPKFNFDLERMKAAIESPISDVTVDDLAKQVKQEPVAWMYKQMDCHGEWGTIFKVDKPYITYHDIKDIVPVYTAPPKREPLSFEDLNIMWCGNPIDFARRIESIHGIGVDDEN